MTELIDTRRVFIKKQAPWIKKTIVGPEIVSQPRKEVSKVYYKPDGSGRDSHIISSNGGT